MKLDHDIINQKLELAQQIDAKRGFISGAVAREDTDVPAYRETLAPKEYPHAPYQDEMLGSLYLGPEYVSLNARLQGADLSIEETQELTNRVSQLITEATAREDWRYGPFNERKMIQVRIPSSRPTAPDLSKQPEVRDFNNDPPFTDILDNDPDDAPYIDESELLDKNPLDQTPKSTQEPEKNKNWLQRKIQEWKDFDAYAKRNRKEADILALVGSGAGIGSAIVGAGAAELALSLALPGIVAGPVGIAAGLAINYFVFSKMMRKWSEGKMSEQLNTLNLDPSEAKAKIEENIKLDHKMRVKAFATADVFMKIVTGLGLGGLLHNIHNIEPTTSSHNGEFPGKDDILPSNTVDTQPSLPGDNPITETPYATESSAVPTPEIPHQNLVDYVVKASDNSWEQVLHQNGMETMGPDSIKVLSMNRDNIIQMFEKWATTHGGNGTVPIEMGPHSVMQETPVSDVVKMLDEAIRNGYPTEALAKQDYAEYARQLANYERVTKWVLPGTHLQFPAK